MQERAWRKIRGEAGRLEERDREVAERERSVGEEEEAVAHGAHRVIPDANGGHGKTVAVREKGKRGGRRTWACAEKATPGGRAESGGRSGCAAAPEPQPRTDADRLGFGVPTAAAVCAASGREGAGDSPGVEGGGIYRVGPLPEVGCEHERGTGEARTHLFCKPGPQGRGVCGTRGRRWRSAGEVGCWERRSEGWTWSVPSNGEKS